MTIQNLSYNPIYNTILIYLIIMMIIIIIKPQSLFIKENKSISPTTKCLLKPFGCGQNKTIFTIHAIGIILSIVLYFFISLYESVQKV